MQNFDQLLKQVVRNLLVRRRRLVRGASFCPAHKALLLLLLMCCFKFGRGGAFSVRIFNGWLKAEHVMRDNHVVMRGSACLTQPVFQFFDSLPHTILCICFYFKLQIKNILLLQYCHEISESPSKSKNYSKTVNYTKLGFLTAHNSIRLLKFQTQVF